MVGGTKFHRGILKAGLGRMSKSNGNRKIKVFPRREKSKPFAVAVSLDNADRVIEGGPLKPGFGLSGAVHPSQMRRIEHPRLSSCLGD